MRPVDFADPHVRACNPPTAPGAFAAALTADIGVVLDPRPGGAKHVTAVAFDHSLHQLVLDPPGGVGRIPSRRPSSMLDRPFLP